MQQQQVMTWALIKLVESQLRRRYITFFLTIAGLSRFLKMPCDIPKI